MKTQIRSGPARAKFPGFVEPTKNASTSRCGIFKSWCGCLAILSLYPEILFDSSCRRVICNLLQTIGPQWFARHHRVLAMKAILTTIMDRSGASVLRADCLSMVSLQIGPRSTPVLWIALEICCRCKGNMPKDNVVLYLLCDFFGPIVWALFVCRTVPGVFCLASGAKSQSKFPVSSKDNGPEFHDCTFRQDSPFRPIRTGGSRAGVLNASASGSQFLDHCDQSFLICFGGPTTAKFGRISRDLFLWRPITTSLCLLLYMCFRHPLFGLHFNVWPL